MDKFHLIGIKGTGMSALAGILQDLGCKISGSDVEEDFFTTKKLFNRGIKPLIFDENNIVDDKVYIASSCYQEDNPEVKKVKEMNLPFFYYHEFIEYYFRKTKIGISGTHGKTTTTSLLANFMKEKKIAYLIGDGSGEATTDYQYFIFEACEYKNHFLNYTYDYLIINNVDYDHPDFFSSIDEVKESFQKAANRANTLIINADDKWCNTINHANKITFGMNDANVSCNIIEKHLNGYNIEVQLFNKTKRLFLPFAGEYMIYNFLAALTASYLNGVDIDNIQKKLLNYQKPSRRMEEYYYYDNIIIDDYAHHPKEIEECIKAIEQMYPSKELIIIFQPHTYTRTFALEKEFQQVFKNYELYLARTFTSKREEKSKKFDNKVFTIFPNAKVFNIQDIKELKKRHNSVILFLGAGNIDKYISEFL